MQKREGAKDFSVRYNYTHIYTYHVRPLPHEGGLSLRARLKRFAQKLPLRDPTLGERQPVSTLERRQNYS